MSIMAELTKHVLDTPFEAFDQVTLQRARDRLIDVIGCVIAGADAPGCSMILDMIRYWGGKKEATIFVHGGKVPAHDAALVNCVMCRSYDVEPT